MVRLVLSMLALASLQAERPQLDASVRFARSHGDRLLPLCNFRFSAMRGLTMRPESCAAT